MPQRDVRVDAFSECRSKECRIIFGKKKRIIRDYDFSVRDGWHGVELDEALGESWARALATESTSDPQRQEVVLSQLRAVRSRLNEISDPSLLAAVWIPEEDRVHVKCALAFQIIDQEPKETPQSKLAEYDNDAGRRDVGEVYDDVETWMNAIDAGVAVGTRQVITYRDTGEESGHTEVRILITVYPPDCSQKIEFAYTTQDLVGFDDFIEISMGSVATLTVELGT